MSKTTPATKALQKLGVKFALHSYVYDSNAESIGLQAAEALGAGLKLDWGNIAAVANAETVGLTLAAGEQRAGWQYAHWLVAHSTEKGVEWVRYGTQEWTASSGRWRQVVDNSTSPRVVAAVYPS